MVGVTHQIPAKEQNLQMDGLLPGRGMDEGTFCGPGPAPGPWHLLGPQATQETPVKTVYIVRHAESVANAGGRTDSPSAIGLSERGIQQANDLVAPLTDLDISAVVVSPYPRTRLTADPFLATRPDLIPEVWGIHEFTFLDEDNCRGTTQKERGDRRKAFWGSKNPEFKDGPKSESFSEVMVRANWFLNKIVSAPDKTAVFTHGQFVMICIAILHAPKATAAEIMHATYIMQYEQKRNLKNAQILPLNICDGKIIVPGFPGVEKP